MTTADNTIEYEAFGRNVVAQAEALGRDDPTVGQAVAGVTGLVDLDLDAQYKVTVVRTPDEVSVEILLDEDAPRFVAPRFGD